MSYTLVIAEKPSVARDIARVLGCREKGDGYYTSGDYRVTWAIGHLVSLAEPEEIDEKFKKWRAQDLPILPPALPLKVLPKTKTQYNVVKRQMNAKDCEGLICATDAGREGELIFRYIYRMAGCKKPFSRLWISSMTDEAIRDGFAAIRPGALYDALYESARCRSEADWLVGMNASRAYTLRYGALLSIGRVQTPTLALLVRRHHEITAFKPEDYWTVTAEFAGEDSSRTPAHGPESSVSGHNVYTGLWLNEQTREKRLHTADAAEAVAAKVRGKPATVESVVREEKKEWPPNLYDLTSLQRDANRLLGFTAQKTLSVAQKLYEDFKLLTYPRTDSRHLPRDMAGKTRQAIQALPDTFAAHTAPLLARDRLPMPGRIFDDAKVTDHHAIIPTGKRANLENLPEDARALFDLVARRLIAAFYPDHLYDAVRVLTRSEGEAFESLGREVRQEGWKAVYKDAPTAKAKKKGDDDAQTLPNLTEGERRTVKKATARADKTKPPAPHTDASLLAAMERAGRELEDDALRETMKDSGLGTPATRAAIIERLLAVGYAIRRGRAIQATDKGVKLIAVVPEALASPETTGQWEKSLADIALGSALPDPFLAGIRELAASLVAGAAAAPSDVEFEKEEGKRGRGKGAAKRPVAIAKCPLCGQGDVLENSKAFYCSRWKDGCGLKIWKDCCQKAGGPLLTPALIALALRDGTVRGSTGILAHDKGIVKFQPINKL